MAKTILTVKGSGEYKIPSPWKSPELLASLKALYPEGWPGDAIVNTSTGKTKGTSKAKVKTGGILEASASTEKGFSLSSIPSIVWIGAAIFIGIVLIKKSGGK